MDWWIDTASAAARNSSDWLRRLADPGVWVLAVFAVWVSASVVAARLLALRIPTGWTVRVGKSNKKTTAGQRASGFTKVAGDVIRNFADGSGLVPAGLLLILLGSAGWTFVGTTGAEGFPEWAAALGALLDLVGVVTLASGLALRLRLQVNVVGPSGVTNPVQSSYVAARMAALGSSRPRGLLFPHGTDTANLPEDALSTADTDSSKIAAAMLRLLRVLTAVIPWKAEIFVVDKQTAAVTLRRNGRQFETELLAVPTLLPQNSDPTEADSDRALLTAAAAFILFQLSRAYPKLGYGLAGAEHWQSVASQVLATTPPWKNDRQASAELFARAVDYDPKNLAAWVGFLAKSIGSYGSQPTLQRGLPLLQSVLRELNRRDHLELADLPKPNHKLREPYPEEALRIRILRTLTILSNNRRLLETDESRKQEIVSESMKYASQLMESVQSASNPKKEWSHLNEYAKRMQPLAASLYTHVWNLQSPKPANVGWLKEAKEWTPAADATAGKTALATLRYHYDEACATLEELDIRAETAAQGKAAALSHLELALALQELRYGAASDPSFKPLRRDQEAAQFASLVDNTPRIESLDALKGHSEKLASVGIRFATDLLTRNGRGGDANLAQTLQVPQETVVWMRGVCKLAERCPDPMMGVDWTNLLTDEGIDSPQALRQLITSQSFGMVYARIVRDAERSSVEAPERKDLEDWVLNLGGAATSAAAPSTFQTPNGRSSAPTSSAVSNRRSVASPSKPRIPAALRKNAS